MSVNLNIFRAYDIRGIYPREINKKTAYLVGRSFVRFLKKKQPKIIVGRDNRLSSSNLFKSLVRGINEGGGKVINIGLATAPMFYFAVAFYKFDGGIEITASHNPPEYNGFKLVREKAIPLSEKTGLRIIKSLVQKLNKIAPEREKAVRKITSKNILSEYVKFNLKGLDFSKMKPLKIIIDTGNAVAGILISRFFENSPFKIYHIFSKLDGHFPYHLPSPSEKKNLKDLQSVVIKKKADFGVAFDGDGDRIVFVDEKGDTMPGDLITALMAELILRENPAEKILYEICSSRVVKETIEKAGGVPVMSRVGHSFIKETMRKQNIIFGGEISSHYAHRDHFFSESPFFVLFKVIQELSRSNKKLSELIKPYKKYFNSGIIVFKARNKADIIKKIEKKFQNGKILKLDGLRVDFKEWWFSLRPSNTEPIIRLVIEANSQKLMEAKKKEIIKIIHSV